MMEILDHGFGISGCLVCSQKPQKAGEMASLRNQQLLCSMLTVEKPCLCAQRSEAPEVLLPSGIYLGKHSRQFRGPRIGGQLNKICCIQMMEYYSQLQGLT